MTKKQTDHQLVSNCRHTLLREALMRHLPPQPQMCHQHQRSTSVLAGSGLSGESKFYLAILAVAALTLVCHTLINIIQF